MTTCVAFLHQVTDKCIINVNQLGIMSVFCSLLFDFFGRRLLID